MEPISILIIIIVFFVATFFGSMIGGAALLTIPTLIFFGLSPYMALGTNKIGSFGQASGASLGYGLEKKIDYKFGFVFMIFSTIGAVIGTFLILSIPEYFIEKLIGIVMIIVIGFLLFNNQLGIRTKRRNRNFVFFVLFALASGFYIGFYGAGMGIINRFVLVAFFSYAMINSAALSSFANTVTNLFSLVIFSFYGAVQYSLLIPIILTSLIGGYLGSKYAVKIGNVNVKRILLAVALIMAVKLLFF